MLRKLMAVGIAAALSVAFCAGADAAGKKGMMGMKMARLKVMSAEIKRHAMIADEQVANVFGCKGGNVSPSLKWSGEPAGTKSFAISIYDPDAPTGSGFWHWVAFDIPASVHELAKGASAGGMPAGAIQSHNDTGSAGYTGPCPPPGDKPHRYFITVFAVDAEHLGADGNATPAVVGFMLHFHTVAKGRIVGLYSRSK